MIQEVIYADGTEQVTNIVDDRAADQVVRGEVTGDGFCGSLWGEGREVGVNVVADKCGWGFAEKPLCVHNTQIFAGRCLCRRPYDVHQRR